MIQIFMSLRNKLKFPSPLPTKRNEGNKTSSADKNELTIPTIKQCPSIGENQMFKPQNVYFLTCKQDKILKP